ncbi:MAG: hypothetical protein ACE5IY_02050 [bacterium]
MKFSPRWLIQAAAFIGCIFFFLEIWQRSKQMLVSASTRDVWLLVLHGSLFLGCFFVMALTSYLKQRKNGTLENPLPFFEKVLAKMGLAR